MTDIPDGYGIIAGRSRVNAQAALDAAKEAGVDPAEVKAVKEGYLVPEAVLEAFHAAAGVDTADAAAVPASDAGGEHESAAEPDADTPTSDWKNVEIKEWADARNIDLDGATTKADMLAAIATTNKEE
jgi:pyruvate/2-oxoglutarate dehydrogenase complex dihydrolipoamide acyltransferase (E2) component